MNTKLFEIRCDWSAEDIQNAMTRYAGLKVHDFHVREVKEKEENRMYRDGVEALNRINTRYRKSLEAIAKGYSDPQYLSEKTLKNG